MPTSRSSTSIYIEDNFEPKISFHQLQISGPNFLVNGIAGVTIWLTLEAAKTLITALTAEVEKLQEED